MDPSERVCPHCGEPPGPGVFCAACGRNLAAVQQLPTRARWEAGDAGTASPRPHGSLAALCAQSTSAFLETMRTAGCPGATVTPMPARPFRRTRRVRGWVLRAVDREDFEGSKRYEPGLVLSEDGAFHRLDSTLRGWGQRDFPRFEHTVSAEAIPMPTEQRLLDDLARILDEHGLTAPEPG